jgi:RAB protein geranylgeranyltransferase component A
MGDDEQLTTTRLLRDAARSFGDQEILYRTDDGAWQRTFLCDPDHVMMLRSVDHSSPTAQARPGPRPDDPWLTTTRLLRDAARSFGDQEILYRTDDGAWQRTDYALRWHGLPLPL